MGGNGSFTAVGHHPVLRNILLKSSTDSRYTDETQASIGRDSVEVRMRPSCRRWVCADYASSVQMIGDLLESLGLWPFTSKLDWTAAQFEDLMREVRAELQNVELNLYIEL